MKKSIDLNLLFLTPTELAKRNITDIPIERLYYSAYINKQICIHEIQNRYYIYVMNFLPEYYTKNHYKEFKYNTWIRLIGYKNIEDAKRTYKMYLKEMMNEKNERKTITLRDCINYLDKLEEVTNELQ